MKRLDDWVRQRSDGQKVALSVLFTIVVLYSIGCIAYGLVNDHVLAATVTLSWVAALYIYIMF
jgi:hypothetical protein